MICIARTFGAPRDGAGREARAQEVELGEVAAQLADDLRDEVRNVREPLRLEQPLDWTEPGTQTRDRSLRPRSTSITCSARSFSEGGVAPRRLRPAGVVPAIGLTLARCPRPSRASPARSRRVRVAVELEEEEVRRRVDAAE